MNGNLYAQLAESFSRTPETPCLDLPGSACFSYADLERETARYANLLASFGLERGDRVAVQVEKSPQAVFLYLGCMRAGFVYLPLNTAYRESEVSYFLGDAEPRAAVCR